ncbi:MAG: hypothetical protein KDG89_09120 [Geminicoccaceae bacterium]|nr:hypothetical protein [Geminicoccaceae bacterium]
MCDLIEAGEPLAVETVLSTAKYRPHVERARERGFAIGMMFVTTTTPDLNVARVGLRVRVGGHDVPADKIRARWQRSHDQLAVFLPLLDRLIVFDNTHAKPAVTLEIAGGRVKLHLSGRLPAVDAAPGG